MIRVIAALILLAAPAAGQEALYRFDVVRAVDADTFDGVLVLPRGITQPVRIRLDCIQSPERYTEDGAALKGLVAYWLEGRTVYITDQGDGGFGRVLSRVYVPGWDETLSQRLYRLHWLHSPLYTGSQTNKAEIAACARRMGG